VSESADGPLEIERSSNSRRTLIQHVIMAIILTYRFLPKSKPQHNRLLKNRAMIFDAEEFFQYKNG
jgi:hypothetical protein